MKNRMNQKDNSSNNKAQPETPNGERYQGGCQNQGQRKGGRKERKKCDGQGQGRRSGQGCRKGQNR
ncbi:MAG: hypothetical protein GY710_18510 [Desulfobacteraceae bacterium]|nr:hypothetical protein [Desulfobacteraceae bacterium]